MHSAGMSGVVVASGSAKPISPFISDWLYNNLIVISLHKDLIESIIRTANFFTTLSA